MTNLQSKHVVLQLPSVIKWLCCRTLFNVALLMLVPGMLLIGGTFRSPEPSAFPKLRPICPDFNSCRRLPETKRHSSLFLYWSGSKFLVVVAACTPSIHVYLDVQFSFPPMVSNPQFFHSLLCHPFPKLQLQKTLLSFARPWASTSVGAKMQFVSATVSRFIEWKLL